jgi:sirohydrochlorin ferrochelatase
MAGTLLLAPHGVDGGPGSAADHARAIRALGGWDEVRVGCIKAEPSVAAALDGAPPPVTVVPMLMSEGQIHHRLRAGLERLARPGTWRLTRPVGMSRGLPALVLARAAAACRDLGWPTLRTALLLVGHGTPRAAASALHARRLAATLAGRGFSDVAYALLEEPPTPARAAARLFGDGIVVVGLFLDNGPHGDADVRAALAEVARPFVYTGAVGADPGLVPLILALAADRSPGPAAVRAEDGAGDRHERQGQEHLVGALDPAHHPLGREARGAVEPVV